MTICTMTDKNKNTLKQRKHIQVCNLLHHNLNSLCILKVKLSAQSTNYYQTTG